MINIQLILRYLNLTLPITILIGLSYHMCVLEMQIFVATFGVAVVFSFPSFSNLEVKCSFWLKVIHVLNLV